MRNELRRLFTDLFSRPVKNAPALAEIEKIIERANLTTSPPYRAPADKAFKVASLYHGPKVILNNYAANAAQAIWLRTKKAHLFPTRLKRRRARVHDHLPSWEFTVERPITRSVPGLKSAEIERLRRHGAAGHLGEWAENAGRSSNGTKRIGKRLWVRPRGTEQPYWAHPGWISPWVTPMQSVELARILTDALKSNVLTVDGATLRGESWLWINLNQVPGSSGGLHRTKKAMNRIGLGLQLHQAWERQTGADAGDNKQFWLTFRRSVREMTLNINDQQQRLIMNGLT